MSIAIDLALIIFIIISVSLSSKRGFVYSLITLVGYIAAAVVGFALASHLAEYVTDSYIRTAMVDNISAELTTESVEGIMETYGRSFLSGLFSLDGSNLEQYIGRGIEEVAGAIFDNAISPVVTGIVKMAFTVIILMVLFYLIRQLAWLLKEVIHHTFLRSVDVVLGGFLGFARGIVIIICTMFIIKLGMTLGGGHIGSLTPEVIGGSYIFRFFYSSLLGL